MGGTGRDRRTAPAASDRQALRPLDLPKYVAWGDSDPVAALGWLDGIDLAYSRVNVRVLPGVGHFVPAEASVEAAERILAAVRYLRPESTMEVKERSGCA